ncbi:hypothetical protein [Halobacteriovorax sp.]|uniref:hypothetical protein n=1 Tax=Halobacteriovorax sp. TaxID=2020862 RepID=UPI003AF1F229
MIKSLLTLFISYAIIANPAQDDTTIGDNGQDDNQVCLELSQDKLIGLESKPENELVFISNKCSYADFTKELKEKLQAALPFEGEGRLQLSLKDEKINVIMDTLATEHVGSSRFSYEDTKKIEDFYSSTKADSLKQSGNLESLRDDQSDEFYLVLFFNAQKDRLIVIYKRLTEAPVNDVPPTDSDDDLPPSDDLPSEEL